MTTFNWSGRVFLYRVVESIDEVDHPVARVGRFAILSVTSKTVSVSCAEVRSQHITTRTYRLSRHDLERFGRAWSSAAGDWFYVDPPEIPRHLQPGQAAREHLMQTVVGHA